VSSAPTIRGCRRFETSTTCNPALPAATYAKSPETSTLFAYPGIARTESGCGAKLLTWTETVPWKPLLVTVTVASPSRPAKISPSAPPKFTMVRSLEA
jgi:hypothetical protein